MYGQIKGSARCGGNHCAGYRACVVQSALIDAAGGQLVCIGDELIHGAVLGGGGDGQVDGGDESGVALGNANGGTGHVIGNLAHNYQIGVILGIALSHGGLDEGAVKIACQQILDDVGYLGHWDDVGIGGILSCQLLLDGACLGADLKVLAVAVGVALDLVGVGLGGHEGLAALVVDVGEVHGVGTVGVGGKTGKADVDGLVLQLCENAVEVHGNDVKGESQVVGYVLGKSHVKAGQGGSSVGADGVELIGSKIGAGGHGELAVVDGGKHGLQLVDGHCGIIGICGRRGLGGGL